jgi:hypothetical protein
MPYPAQEDLAPGLELRDEGSIDLQQVDEFRRLTSAHFALILSWWSPGGLG